MRSTLLRSLASRSFVRPVQGLVAAAALLVFTGAKGNGCGNVQSAPDDPAPACEPGFHVETVCAPCEIGDMCEDQCVPDAACPPGTIEQWTCSGGDPGAPVACDADGNCTEPPPPGDCVLECVVPDTCGEGFHEEWVCDPQPVPVDGAPPSDPDEPTEPPPPPACYPICVPDGVCPPGWIEQTVCGPDEPPPPPDPNDPGTPPDQTEPAPPCWTECVPPPVCPPGTMEQTVCGPDTTEPGDPDAPDGSDVPPTDPNDPPEPEPCWTECVPVPVCPPGTVPQEVCAGWDGSGEPPPEPVCWLECLPESGPCPDGSEPVITCDEAGVCTVTCGDSGGGGGEEPQPAPEP